MVRTNWLGAVVCTLPLWFARCSDPEANSHFVIVQTTKYGLHKQRSIAHYLKKMAVSINKSYHFRVVMVVGAGRGPLVTASITAAAKADRNIRVYAVEKNANAVVT